MTKYPVAYRSPRARALNGSRQKVFDLRGRAMLPPYLAGMPFRPSERPTKTGPRVRQPWVPRTNNLAGTPRPGPWGNPRIPSGLSGPARTALGGLGAAMRFHPILRGLNGAMNLVDILSGIDEFYEDSGMTPVTFFDLSGFSLDFTCEPGYSLPLIGWVENNLNFCPPQQSIDPGFGHLQTATEISSVAQGTLGRVRIRDHWTRTGRAFYRQTLRSGLPIGPWLDPMLLPVRGQVADPLPPPYRVIPHLHRNPYRSEQTERGPRDRREPPRITTTFRRPGPGEKEKKWMPDYGIAGILMNTVSEAGDMIDSFYDALPDEHKIKWPDGQIKRHNTMLDKARQVYDKFLLQDADYFLEVAKNIRQNMLEDAIIGRLSGAATREAFRSGLLGNRPFGITTGPGI